MSDVADVADATRSIRSIAWFNRQPAVLIWIHQQGDANVIATVDGIKALIPKLVKRHGITDGHIEAQAVVLNSNSFDILNRGISARDMMRRTILKEIRREKRRAEKSQRSNKRPEANDANRDEAITTPAVATANAS